MLEASPAEAGLAFRNALPLWRRAPHEVMIVPKFFFHLRARVPSEDVEGIELPDVAAAREEATRLGRELMGGHGSGGDLVVTNELGEEVLTMYLPARRAAKAARDRASLNSEQRYLAELRHPPQGMSG